jgi:hypothetical protein
VTAFSAVIRGHHLTAEVAVTDTVWTQIGCTLVPSGLGLEAVRWRRHQRGGSGEARVECYGTDSVPLSDLGIPYRIRSIRVRLR